ncbi:MAG: hypothetical protein M1609_10875 [Firmicutes bacterium]|nr:hypothetical protein [Bacillota bacterium]
MSDNNGNAKKSQRTVDKRSIKHNYSKISNISGGITDEEFADEFLAYPTTPNSEGAKFQFNFLGAELEKLNTAKNVRDELGKK